MLAILTSLFLFFVTFLISGVAIAGNVDTLGIGAKATSLGGAFSARADDFSAMYYNPAGIVQLTRPQISVGTSIVNPSVAAKTDYRNEYEEVTGGFSKDKSQLLIYPHAGFIYPFQLFGKKAAFGIATYVPYGLWLGWKEDPSKNPGAYNTYESWYYRVVSASPTLAIQVTDRLMVGFNVAFGNSHSGVYRRIYQSPFIVQAGSGFSQLFNGFVGAGLPTSTASDLSAGLVLLKDPQVFSLVANKVGGASTLSNLITQAIYYGNPIAISALESIFTSPNFYPNLLKVKALPLIANLKDGKMKTRAVDDFNWSFNIGLIYKVRDNLQVGLTYRGPTKTNFWLRTRVYDGNDNKVDSVEGHTWIDHPDQIQAGVYWRPIEKLHLEVDATWTNWRRISHYKVVFNRPLLYPYFYNGLIQEGVDPLTAEALAKQLAISKEDYKRHWMNTVQLRFGAEYQLLDWLSLRAGYYYDPSPIPDKTVDVTWPDTNKHTFAIGTGLKLFGGKLLVDATYQYTRTSGTRSIDWGRSENLNNTFGLESENPEAKLAGRGTVHNFQITVTYPF